MQTKVPYLDLKTQYHAIRGELLPAWEAICESSRFAQGPAAAQFEQEFARYCETRECVSLNSGTSALHLALRCLDVGPGDEVITASMTFIATAWAISYVGAKPVFIDIDPARRTLDPAKIEAAVTPRTKAIIPVHLFGMPADMDAILAVAKKHGLPVIEDAAQAHGARYKNRRIGQFGVMSCFSFYPGKNLGAYGEGGALVTNDAAMAARARSLREHGQSQRYYHEELGYNYRMDSLQGAVLSLKLRTLDQGNGARASHAKRYTELFAGSACVTPQSLPDSDPVWHCYVLELKNRDQVRVRAAEAGIDTAIHYPVPVHLQKAYSHLGYKAGDLPETERLCQRCLSLPMYPELTDEQLRAVASAVRAAAA